jgi:type I restriction enzyme R subunit
VLKEWYGKEMGLGEADTRAKLIDPAIHARGWTEDLIRREEAAPGIDVIDGRPRRRRRGRIDYVLRIRVNPNTQPIAVALIEAKAEDLPPTHGLEQAKCYASCKRLNVPFVFSSNGHLYVEYDRITGEITRPRPLSEFPTPEDLRGRYEAAVGFSLDSDAARPLLVPYRGGESARRYYQDAAIRATLEKFARGEKRALLSLATGSGKTFIAVHMLKKIADGGQLKRALFLCDRDELRSQGLGAFQNVFGSNAAPVSTKNPQKNARILIATYQSLDVSTEDSDANFFIENYPEDYFSHIVIDECHRSAWGKWSIVLKRNPNAIQTGLTATPRQITGGKNEERTEDLEINANNIKHFGEPVYEYDLAQGIEDGYLAACEIIRREIDLDKTGITVEQVLARNPRDAITGEAVTEEQLRELYEKSSYEDRIMLPDRVMVMCQDLFQHLLETGGPEQKTIVFCVRDTHADAVASELNNLYAHWCREKGRPLLENFAFKCTAAVKGSEYLADLRGASRSYFIATTVDLLSTGVDVPVVQNIVFFKYVRSPIAFYQMVGRGTRLHPPTNKLLFRVYDYTNATRLFGEEFFTRATTTREKPSGPGPEGPIERPIVVEGFDVHVTGAGTYIVTSVDGKATPVTVEEYQEKLAERLVEEAPSLDQFRAKWIFPRDRQALLARLPEGERGARMIQQITERTECDLYDVLGELGYGMAPKTQSERAGAFNYKNAGWLAGLPTPAAGTIRALTAQFERGGTDALENPHVFETSDVIGAGGLAALKSLGKPSEILMETKRRLFTA